MSELEISGVTYRVDKMDARKQFHLARRLTPVMSSLVGNLSANAKGPELLAALQPMSEAIASMPEDDADKVITACLSVCMRANPHGTGWSPTVAPNGKMMFEDVQLPQMLQLVWAAIQENLGGFFSALPSVSAEEASPPA